MEITNTEIYGYRAAVRGMRNPMDSWPASDSAFTSIHYEAGGVPRILVTDINRQPSNRRPVVEGVDYSCAIERPYLGEADLNRACKLIRRGGDHRKFLRMIVVWCDLVLPRYVWQEVDTYKVGTVRNSCSTMNTLGKRPLEQDDFEGEIPAAMLAALNQAIDDFREADGSAAKRAERVTMKDLLPEGFLQRATFLLNYEVGFRMFFSRRGHRLPMWREGCEGSICEWIKSWPYMGEFLSAGAR